MSAARARAYAVCTGGLALSLTFFLCGVVAPPVLVYYPLARRWEWSGSSAAVATSSASAASLTGPGGPLGQLSMDYYGRTLIAVVVGIAVALVTHVVLRARDHRQPSATDEAALRLLVLHCATALLLCIGLYGYQLLTREATPAPLPTWYIPK